MIGTKQNSIFMIKDRPLVSVLLCTYNDERYINDAIESILNQSYKNFEFIILNDGSTDNTKAIIQSYTDPRIRYFEHQENKGLEEAKNWGLSKVQGKYVAYIDGDDIAFTERLQIQVEYMENNPKVGICGSIVQTFGKENGIRYFPEKDLDIRCRALVGTPLSHPSCMIKMDVITENKIAYRKDFKAAEDYPFMVEVMMNSEAYCLQTPLIKYRIHDQSISSIHKKTQFFGSKKGRDFAYRHLLNIKPTFEEQNSYSNLFNGCVFSNCIEGVNNLQKRIIIDRTIDSSILQFRTYFLNFLEHRKKEFHSWSWKLISFYSLLKKGINCLATGEKTIFMLLMKLRRIRTSS